MPEFYVLFARKIHQNSQICVIFARKINKISEFYTIFARKMSEFYMVIGRKIFFPIFFLGGGTASVTLSPVSYAYGRIRLNFKLSQLTPAERCKVMVRYSKSNERLRCIESGVVFSTSW